MKAALVALLIVLTAQALMAQSQTPSEQLHLKKGINFDIWVDWQDTAIMVASPGFLSTYPDWRRHVASKAITSLPDQGFDFARLPMDPAPLLAIGPGARQDALIDQIRIDADLIQSAGLKVVVDIHTFPRPHEDWGVDQILADPAKFDAYTTLIGKIAARLSSLDPTRTAFEPINEPTTDCDAIYGTAVPTWPAQLAQLHAIARQNAPNLPLILTGACWGGPEGLATLTPIDDPNTLYSFHSYTPFLFTHQGADWTDGLQSVLHHLPYPPTMLSRQTAQDLARDTAQWARSQQITTAPPATQANLIRAFAQYRDSTDGHVTEAAHLAAAWADKYHIPHSRLIMGEFGANRSANETTEDKASRQRFLRAKALSAHSVGIGWAIWSWSGSFGITDGSPNRIPDPALCAAIGLTCR